MKQIPISYEQLHGHVLNILRQMIKDNWKPDYVVGITRGGLLSAALISQYLDIPMHTLKVTLRDSDSSFNCESNCWMSEDAYGHIDYDPMVSSDGRKNILIVDDINDTGATINWIRNDWQSNCAPDSERWNDIWHFNVRFAVIVNNLASEQNIDYGSMEINKVTDPSWVQFPTENWWHYA